MIRTPLQVGKEIKRIITFETNSMGEPMAVVIYKKKPASPPQPTSNLETAALTAKTILGKVVESQLQAASEFQILNEKSGSNWLKELGKNVSLALVKGGDALDLKLK